MNKFSISGLAIRRHIGTLALSTTAIVLGLFFVFQIQVDLLPAITYPRIGLRVTAPGISPEVAVEEITKPLEEALSVTEGVVQIYSQTREGRVSLNLYFRPGGDIDIALNDATAAFNRARNRLPDLVEAANIFKFEPSGLPVYELALQSDSLEAVELRVFADEELSRELSVVPGVSIVDVTGGVNEEVRVKIDPVRLQALGLGLRDVLDELDDRNLDVSGGRLVGGKEEPLTRTVGRFKTAAEIENIAFERGDRRIYLRDFAEVIDGTTEQRVYVYLNNSPAVKVSIQKQQDANTIEVIKALKQRLNLLRQSGLISEDINLTVTKDESIFIRNAISNVALSGLSGATLAALTVLVFLGSLRQTLIIVIAIPLATLVAIVLMKLFGLSLNVFSLGGLALGVGIVVDNAIVMLETIAEGIGRELRSQKSGSDVPWYVCTGSQELDTNLISSQYLPQYYRGKDVIYAAENSSSKIESALLASTSTNLVAVVPFLLVGGLFSLIFNELILTISFAVASSLLIALTVVPMLASRLLALPYSSGLNEFFLLKWFDRSFQAATATYQKLLAKVLQYRLLILALAFIVLGGSSIILEGQLDREILPRINTGQVRLFAIFPSGTTLNQNRQVMKLVNDILLSQPETEYVFTTSGGFVFGNSSIANVLRGSSTIGIKPGSNLDAYIERCNREFNRLNLVNTRLRISPETLRGISLSNSPTRAEIDVTLQGTDPKLLQQAGRQVLKELDRNVSIARFRPNTDPQESEVQIIPDTERLAQYDLSIGDLGQAIQTAIEGTVITELQRDDRLVDIRVELDNSIVQNIAQLAQLPVLVGENRSVYLQDVANISLGKAPGEIQRINRRNVFLISGSLAEGGTLSEAFDRVNTVLAAVKLPPGVTIVPSFTQEANQQLQNSLVSLGSLAAFLVFVVMAVQYNSLIDPLVIIFTIPLALAGGIFGLYLTNTAIGATVLVGAILLVGIVVNNAIVMVELANQIHTEFKLDRYHAILKASSQRLRPILMTTITTVLGLFPLALGIGQGSEFLQPLGIVVFSGLSLATFLTLFIIPCFYVLLHDLFARKIVSRK